MNRDRIGDRPRRRNVLDAIFHPIDISSLVFFRIAFGSLMFWEVWSRIHDGWITTHYVKPLFHFTYYGFQWVQPWPPIGMYLHFYALSILAIGIVIGYRYRFCAALFFIGFTYTFLIERALFLNHLYLSCLLSGLMIFVPAHGALSVDSVRDPTLRQSTAPAWTLWILRIQFGLAYFFGGVAKLNGDWLHGYPMSLWMAERVNFPLIGSWFTERWLVLFFSYGAMLLDLLVVPLLLWRRTRMLAFAIILLFHAMNMRLWNIGIFPWLMIAGTLLFFDSDWPRRLVGRFRMPGHDNRWQASRKETKEPRRRWTIGLLGLYVGIQLFMPLRPFFYPGVSTWTGEGHLFSWHMLLRNLRITEARFLATDPIAQESWQIDPNRYLEQWQSRRMISTPDMILQFSHHVAEILRKEGREGVQVRASVKAGLNGRVPQQLVNPSVDLAAQKESLRPALWIVPLLRTSSAGDDVP